ncbi:hypothetical protein ACWDZ6_26130 [Streptomyces sp. NPDC002926]
MTTFRTCRVTAPARNGRRRLAALLPIAGILFRSARSGPPGDPSATA